MSDTITIYKQIYPEQCKKLSKLGYRSIINIRPDGEAPDQPTSQNLGESAKNATLKYVYLPYDDNRLSIETIQKFAEYYHQLPKPIMLFCASGARAKLLYQSAIMQGLL